MHLCGKSTKVWAQIGRVLILRDKVTENRIIYQLGLRHVGEAILRAAFRIVAKFCFVFFFLVGLMGLCPVESTSVPLIAAGLSALTGPCFSHLSSFCSLLFFRAIRLNISRIRTSVSSSMTLHNDGLEQSVVGVRLWVLQVKQTYL